MGSLYETVSNIPFLGVANRTPPSPLPAQPATVATEAAPVPNAYVYSASATFWIEWVRDPGGPAIPLSQPGVPPPAQILALEPFWEHATHLQLQYSQLVILFFNGVLWPHVTVATMTLSAGYLTGRATVTVPSDSKFLVANFCSSFKLDSHARGCLLGKRHERSRALTTARR